jgi:kynurenine formamidase
MRGATAAPVRRDATTIVTVTDLPSYAWLQGRTDAPAGSSWGLFGADDQIGTLNLAGPAQARAGAGCVRTGETFSLDYPLDAFDPPITPTRKVPSHHVFGRHADARDDYLDGFYPQASSQWDGLRHRRDHRHGFYNGVPDERITPDGEALGIQHWAQRGVAGRGLLLDLDAARRAADAPIDHAGGEHLGVADLDAALSRQGVTPADGDILLLHTGWAQWYLGATVDVRDRVRTEIRVSGLDQDHAVLAWLWDHRFAAVVSDTYALEAMPARPDSPFGRQTDPGWMHQHMLAMLGMAIGELWRLTPLALACAADRRWTCLLTAAPLHLRGGVGSPANALAVR